VGGPSFHSKKWGRSPLKLRLCWLLSNSYTDGQSAQLLVAETDISAIWRWRCFAVEGCWRRRSSPVTASVQLPEATTTRLSAAKLNCTSDETTATNCLNDGVCFVVETIGQRYPACVWVNLAVYTDLVQNGRVCYSQIRDNDSPLFNGATSPFRSMLPVGLSVLV